MSNQIPPSTALPRTASRVRGWNSAAVERPDPERVRVTNTRAGQWVELCHYEGAEMASMTVGRVGQGAFFQPDWALPTTDFVTFRARECARACGGGTAEPGCGG